MITEKLQQTNRYLSPKTGQLLDLEYGDWFFEKIELSKILDDEGFLVRCHVKSLTANVVQVISPKFKTPPSFDSFAPYLGRKVVSLKQEIETSPTTGCFTDAYTFKFFDGGWLKIA